MNRLNAAFVAAFRDFDEAHREHDEGTLRPIGSQVK
jgi:hypothetical protein